MKNQDVFQKFISLFENSWHFLENNDVFRKNKNLYKKSGYY